MNVNKKTRLGIAAYFKSGSIILIILLAIYTGAKLLIPMIAAPLIGKSLLMNQSGFSQQVYASNGELLRVTLSTDDKLRIWTPIDEISPSLIKATLLQEDQYFYLHPGINPWAMLKGIWSTISSSNKIGASTITMQLARLRFGIRTRSIPGKINQIAHAIMLEALYSKSDILEAYLNIAPYGGNIEGVGAAALTYFSKSSDRLNWPEALSLSVIPQDPNNRIPSHNQLSFQKARERLYKKALKKGLVEGSFFEAQYPTKGKSNLPDKANHFVRRILNEYPHELEIKTSLDIDLQEKIERLVENFIERNKRIGISNASVLLLNSQSMEVQAYLGSADFWSRDIYGQNDAIMARRSPGSALKPFMYGLAIDDGLIHPGSLLKDTEFSRASYNPENYEKDFVGPINATEALIRSRNIPAVMLSNQLSSGRFYSFLQAAGIGKLKSEAFYGLSIILGGVEVRIDELAELYAMLSRGGNLKKISILKNEADNHAEISLLSPESAKLILEMLRENPRPLGGFDSSQTINSLAVPWKTGTSFGFRDAWAAGIVGPYTLIVWLGNFDSQGNPVFIGRDSAGPLFFSIADALAADSKLSEPQPSKALNIKKVKVCAVSGELPTQHCKHLKYSWFIPGKSPIQTCQIHRQISIDATSGLRLCPGDLKANAENRIYEFWPSDLMQLFREAGIPRTIPPSFKANCKDEPLSGSAPLISSPQANITYQLEKNRDKIPFSAVTDGENTRTFWFVDDSFVAETAPSETFFWQAREGQFLIRAVDSQGRSNQVGIKVSVNPIIR